MDEPRSKHRTKDRFSNAFFFEITLKGTEVGLCAVLGAGNFEGTNFNVGQCNLTRFCGYLDQIICGE